MKYKFGKLHKVEEIYCSVYSLNLQSKVCLLQGGEIVLPLEDVIFSSIRGKEPWIKILTMYGKIGLIYNNETLRVLKIATDE